MKYLVEFGYYIGCDGSAVVRGDMDDVYDLIDQAARYGAGYCIEIDEMEQNWECDKRHGEEFALRCEDVFEYAENYDMCYFDGASGFVETRYIHFRPMPPNAQLGLVSYREEPKRLRFNERKALV